MVGDLGFEVLFGRLRLARRLDRGRDIGGSAVGLNVVHSEQRYASGYTEGRGSAGGINQLMRGRDPTVVRAD